MPLRVPSILSPQNTGAMRPVQFPLCLFPLCLVPEDSPEPGCNARSDNCLAFDQTGTDGLGTILPKPCSACGATLSGVGLQRNSQPSGPSARLFLAARRAEAPCGRAEAVRCRAGRN